MQHRLLHYRMQLFQLLRIVCSQADIDLQLVHGEPTAAERVRADAGCLDWAVKIENRSLHVRGRDILWQPLPALVGDSDLVVFMQESRLLSNYPWLFGMGPAKTRVGYWGHGRNFQAAAPTGLREQWKRLLINRVDWWFAYTEMTRDIVLAAGYPDARVTVLNNAIDNASFAAHLAGVDPAIVAALRRQIGATASSTVGLFCGSLYPDKRLDLLLAAGERIVASRPDFRLVVIGDGPSRHLMENPAHKPWLHWVGAKRGVDKAAWFKLAQLYLNPGLVGLHVLDSFVAGTPMVTTVDARHSPEIAYLQHDVNGLITPGDPVAYADEVLGLLANPVRLQRLRQAAMQDVARYTLDEMVNRFTQGILSCVTQPRLRR